ncbi:transcriptional regulatory moc3 [Fusarium pseudocircinatum]|uniref:Transcriptional regulatory moc3 n=1 Tax=Fusarium pseudocircinatum TaxID=56676 RepID=A0A8H5KTX7_9HYPO|nr:transcriptional regulatory moc3 [Fusarium pseudocircinatum]
MKCNLSTARAVDHFRCARDLLDELLGDDSQDFGTALVSIFLLCVFQLIFTDETVAVFEDQSQILLQRLESWVQYPSSHSPLSKRLNAWLKIIQAITMRGGGGGLLSEAFYELLPNYEGALPFLEMMPDHEQDVSTELHEVLGAPLFDFYLQLQILSGRIAKETHYHRSRFVGKPINDAASNSQTNPFSIGAEYFKSYHRSYSYMQPACFAEYVEIDHVLGDPLTKWTGPREAIQTIKEIVDDDWEENDVAHGKELNSGYLRALFLCAIECMDREQSQWAIRRIREIRSATYRTEFFAEFARALSEAQMERERRVISKYFCIWYFGGQPLFL